MDYTPRDNTDEFIVNFLYSQLEFYKLNIESAFNIKIENSRANEIVYENFLQNAKIEIENPNPPDDEDPDETKNPANGIYPTADGNEKSFLHKAKDFIMGLFDGHKTAGEIIAAAGCKMLAGKHLRYENGVSSMQSDGSGGLVGDCSAFTSTIYKMCANIDIGRHCGAQISNDNGSKWSDFSNNVYKKVHDGTFFTGEQNMPKVENLSPGDLLFYGGKNDESHSWRDYGASHVELYVGDGKLLGAGGSGIRKLRGLMLKCGGLYIGAKRYVNADTVVTCPEDFGLPTVGNILNGNWKFVGEGGRIGTMENITIAEALQKAFGNAIVSSSSTFDLSGSPKGVDWMGRKINPADKISEYFTVADLTKARPQYDNRPTADVLQNLTKLAKTVLDTIVNAGAKKFVITCAYRCPAYNKSLGSSNRSQHLTGQAVDIDCNDGPANLSLFKLMVNLVHDNKMEVGQLIWENHSNDPTKDSYPGWIHVSIPRERSGNLRALHNSIIRLVGNKSANWPSSYHP